MTASPPPPSTLATRWVAPMVVLLLGAALSAWVEMRIPTWRFAPDSKPLWLGALPGVGFLVLVGVRLVAGPTGRHGDLVLTWLIAFLTGMHALILAVGVGILATLELAVPIATGLLFLGLGAAVAGLEPGSAMGIRVRATLESAETWRRTHRLFGSLLAASGVLAIALAIVSSVAALAALIALPAASLIAAIARAGRSGAGREQDAAAHRLP